MSASDAAATDRTLVRIVLLVLAVVVLGPLLVMSLAMPAMGVMAWGWGGGATGMTPWWGLGMSLGWLLVLVALGYVVYRALVGRGGLGSARDPAIEELRLAYARGDLTDEEFEDRRSVLAADRSP